jgi:hypothetical protein
MGKGVLGMENITRKMSYLRSHLLLLLRKLLTSKMNVRLKLRNG